MATYHECDRCGKDDKPTGDHVQSADYEVITKHPIGARVRSGRFCDRCASEVENIMSMAFSRAITHKGKWQDIFA